MGKGKEGEGGGRESKKVERKGMIRTGEIKKKKKRCAKRKMLISSRNMFTLKERLNEKKRRKEKDGTSRKLLNEFRSAPLPSFHSSTGVTVYARTHVITM